MAPVATNRAKKSSNSRNSATEIKQKFVPGSAYPRSQFRVFEEFKDRDKVLLMQNVPNTLKSALASSECRGNDFGKFLR